VPSSLGFAGEVSLLSSKHAPRWVLCGYLIIYGLIQLLLGYRSGFRPAENDFLGNLNIANGIDFGAIETVHNGFFAAGLPVMLTLIPDNAVFWVTGVISLLSGLAALVATYVVTGRLAGRWWGLAAVVLLSANPLFFDYCASPGPDLIAVGLTTVALAVYACEALRKAPPRPMVLLLAGLIFGAAGLFRAHALVLAGGLLLWTLLQSHERVRMLAFAGLGVVIGILPQIVINLLGGFGPLEADTGFYVYESTLGMDWYTTGAIPRELYDNPLRVVIDHPLQFLSAYVMALTNYVIPIAMLVLSTLLARSRPARLVLMSILASTVAFALAVSVASSPRGPLPILPQAAIGFAVVLAWTFTRTSAAPVLWQRIAVVGVLVAAVIWPQMREIALATAAKQQAASERAAVEAAVLAGGRVTEASQVLTDDFFLYFTGIPGNVPDRIGGWENISLNGRQPHIDVSLASIHDFYCDARSRGINTVLWKPAPMAALHPGLDAALSGASSSPLLVNAAGIGPYVVTELPSIEGECAP
jgi:hypothetical protein